MKTGRSRAPLEALPQARPAARASTRRDRLALACRHFASDVDSVEHVNNVMAAIANVAELEAEHAKTIEHGRHELEHARRLLHEIEITVGEWRYS